MNKQLTVALVIHIVIALSFIADPEHYFLSYVVGAIVVFNLIGMAIIQFGNKVVGAWIFLVSSAFLLPIGLIGAYGARKIIDDEKRTSFYVKEDSKGKDI